MPTTQLLGQPTDYPQGNNQVTGNGAGAITPRSPFNPTSSTTSVGYFIGQDSYYGNSFIPVLPRFDSPTSNHLANQKP